MKYLIAKMITKLSSSKLNQKDMEKAILDRNHFINLIKLERDRTHRTHQQFSLVLISVNGNHNGNVSITKKISKRVRSIDRVGWYDDSHIGILLPNTTYAGAQVFLKDIKRTRNQINSNMDVVIMTYPEKRILSDRLTQQENTK